MPRIEFVSFLGSVFLLLLTIELIRRRYISERYSLLWLLTSITLVVLSPWESLLLFIARLMGIVYAPTTLFVLGFGFVLLILLQFSASVTSLREQNKKLAQEIAILRAEQGKK
jgi:hypothetical protein